MKQRTLADVAIGEEVIVDKVQGTGSVRRRIMDMGITKRTKVLVHKAAPLGDPIGVRLRHFELSLRKEDAKMILVHTPQAGE